MDDRTTVSHSAFIQARQGYSADLGGCLSRLLAPSRAMAGCLYFSVQRSQCDEHLWQVAGFWRDQAAMDAWLASEAMQVFSDVVQYHMISSVDLHTFRAANAAVA
ncbi:putative quinol monooxygenase [Pseudomonas sp. nanlin1]|uniref:putative quinol monooxygenase n=1 Tax=Pseudomonas sp. nanlin1 TaxID=3040605 RepID=UPI00388F7BFB